MKIRKFRKFWLWGAGVVLLIVAVVNIFLGEYNNAACAFLWLAVLIIDQKNLLGYEEIIDWQDEVIKNMREEIEHPKRDATVKSAKTE